MGLGLALRVSPLDSWFMLCQHADEEEGSHPAVRLGSWNHSGFNNAQEPDSLRESATVYIPRPRSLLQRGAGRQNKWPVA